MVKITGGTFNMGNLSGLDQDSHGAPDDGDGWRTGDCFERVYRNASRDHKPSLGSAYRDRADPTYRHDNLGFRIARD